MSEELKPCPFCGGEAVYNKCTPSEHSYVICDNLDCETMGPTADSEAAAILAWNTRYLPGASALNRAVDAGGMRVGVSDEGDIVIEPVEKRL